MHILRFTKPHHHTHERKKHILTTTNTHSHTQACLSDDLNELAKERPCPIFVVVSHEVETWLYKAYLEKNVYMTFNFDIELLCYTTFNTDDMNATLYCI